MSRTRGRQALRAAAAAACLAGPLLARAASSPARPPGLRALGLSWGPLAAVIAWGIWRSRLRAPLALLGVAVAGLLWWQRAALLRDPGLAYLAEHAGSLMLFGIVFGSTLRAGQVPLVTRFAAMVRTTMPPRVLRYTRGVTLAWTVFFAAMACASLALFALCPLRDWVWFASAWTPALVLSMFVVEYAVRRILLGPQESSGPCEAVRAYMLYTSGRQPPLALGHAGGDARDGSGGRSP